MSFYVTVYDTTEDLSQSEEYEKHEITWVCGWQWYDFGRALQTYGGVVSEEDTYIVEVTLGKMNELFDAADFLFKSDEYRRAVEICNADYQLYESYVYEDLLGQVDFADDLEVYNEISDPAIAKAIRLADLEYAEKRRAEVRDRQIKTYTLFNQAINKIKNWQVADAIKELLKSERFIDVVDFLIKIKEFKIQHGDDYKVAICCG